MRNGKKIHLIIIGKYNVTERPFCELSKCGRAALHQLPAHQTHGAIRVAGWDHVEASL